MNFSFIEAQDLVTIAILVVLEFLLSADNALVLAVLVNRLPQLADRKHALRYGMIGAFALRVVATIFVAQLIALDWVKLVGALYMFYLAIKHFFLSGSPDNEQKHVEKEIRTFLGLTLFWSVVVRVEFTDAIFAVDSILAGIAMSKKAWVVISGGILGIVAMRLVTGKLLLLIERYPALVNGAYVIIIWIGIKLLLEYFHAIGILHFQLDKWISLGVVVIIFVTSFIIARRKPV